MIKRICIVVAAIVVFLGVALLINFIPTWDLATENMHVLEGQWINVYYETEEAAALDVFEYADSSTAFVAQRLGFTEKPAVNVYIYDHQKTMQTKKYGFIAPYLGLDWYIGDNIGAEVILTSPANPGKMHDYDNNKYAVLHEIVHAYVSVMNKDIDLWLTEGMANYLSNGVPFYKDYLNYAQIPPLPTETATILPTPTSNILRLPTAGTLSFR